MAHSTFDERILRVAREAGFGIKAYSYDFVTNRIRKVFPLGTQVGDLRIKAAIAGLRASHRDQFAGEERDYRRESAAALLDRAKWHAPQAREVRGQRSRQTGPDTRAARLSVHTLPALKMAIVSGDLPWPAGLRSEEPVAKEVAKVAGRS
jgi:hypothetical protein